MGKNNHNAGMHFVTHSNYGQYDNLAFYDKKSAEGIANRRYEAIANLEEMGEYLFAKSASFVQISMGDSEFDFPKFYKVFVYDEEHENTLKSVSTIRKLYNPDDLNEQEIRVREHDRQHIIYITSEIYEEKKQYINTQTIYKLK